MPTQFNDALGLDLGFVRRASNVQNARAYEVLYPEMDYASLIPVNTNYPEWADGVDSFIGDKVGVAKWQSGYAKDVPLAEVTLQMVTSKFAMYAVGYRWNVEELGKAQFQNYPLTSRKAEAARFASEVFTWECALTGAGHPGWGGLTNSAYVTPVAEAAPWVDAAGNLTLTPQEVVARLNFLLMGPPSDVGPISALLGDTVLLPPTVYQAIATTAFGSEFPGVTVLAFFQAHNIYTARTGQPVTVRELPMLARAATVGIAGGGRAIGYRNSPDVLELPLPMPYRFLPVYQDGPLQYTVPGIGRVGQLQLFRSNGLRYLDGVSPVPAA